MNSFRKSSNITRGVILHIKSFNISSRCLKVILLSEHNMKGEIKWRIIFEEKFKNQLGSKSK